MTLDWYHFITFITNLKVKEFTVSSVNNIDTSIRPSGIYDINLQKKIVINQTGRKQNYVIQYCRSRQFYFYWRIRQIPLPPPKKKETNGGGGGGIQFFTQKKGQSQSMPPVYDKTSKSITCPPKMGMSYMYSVAATWTLLNIS